MNFDYPKVNAQIKAEERLVKYAKQQEILLQVSILFSSVEDFDKQVSKALAIAGEYTGVSRVYIFKDEETTMNSHLIFEWRNAHIPTDIDHLQTISYHTVPSWKTALHQKGCLMTADIHSLAYDLVALLSAQKVKSILVVPLFLKGKIIGFIGFDDCLNHKQWENSDLEFISTMSNIISHAFERHYTEQELKSMLEHQHRINQELVRQNLDLQQFTYIVSHNLRAPVANLLGLVSLYRTEDSINEVNQIAIENIKTVSRQLDGIVRDLNEIVEIKQHLIAETKENVSFEEELAEILNSLQKQIYLARAEINIDFSKVSHIFTIRKYLNSILLNLLSNALKYKHPERCPLIEISSYIVDNFVLLQVKDNGLGIDLKKNGHKLFGFHKRFHSHVEGKGIGLYLVKQQTEVMGGKVEVESQPEQGSIFKVYLPR
jgi:signal transduction histidine kinase